MNRPTWITTMQQGSILLLLWSLLLIGCGSTQQVSYSHNATNDNTTGKTRLLLTGCGHNPAIQLGTSADVTIAVNPAVSLGQHTRLYRVHVPTTYRTNQPQPVVFVFHGYAGTAVGMERTTGFSPLADQQDFLAVYPQGMIEPRLGKPFFAELGPIDYGVDEISFVSDMLNDLQTKFCIDTARVFSTGFSNGGGLSALLACRFAQGIAAIAPVEGPFNDIPGGCHPARPVSILDVHGTNDQSVPYYGIPISEDPSWPYPPIQQWLQGWATRDGCTGGPTVFLQTTQVVGEKWSHCRNSTAVAHYRIIGGTHSWPTSINGHSTASEIWQFFQALPLP